MLIRKVNSSDCKDIFVWRNDNLTRKMSFNQSLISIENHDKWFNKILSDQNVVTYLGNDENFKIGICRFQIIEKKRIVEVSININPKFRNKGFAKILLEKSIQKFRLNFNYNLFAKIKKNNTASIKIFRYAGFFKIKTDKDKFVYSLPKSKLSFSKVRKTDTEILYELLKQRKHKISNQKIPSFFEHTKFVKNNRYVQWYIIKKVTPIGTFYLQNDNSIGINIKNPNVEFINETLQFIKTKFKPQEPIPSKIPPYFYMNIPSHDKKLFEILNSLEHDHIQVSFKLNLGL